MKTLKTNTMDSNFPFTDKEIRLLYANAATLEVSKDDNNLCDFVSPKVLDMIDYVNSNKLYPYTPITLKYALGRAYFLTTGKTLN